MLWLKNSCAFFLACGHEDLLQRDHRHQRTTAQTRKRTDLVEESAGLVVGGVHRSVHDALEAVHRRLALGQSRLRQHKSMSKCSRKLRCAALPASRLTLVSSIRPATSLRCVISMRSSTDA